MPAGASWSKYLTFVFASLASALAGSQVVHLYYRPSLVSEFFCFVTIMLSKFEDKYITISFISISLKSVTFELHVCTHASISDS